MENNGKKYVVKYYNTIIKTCNSIEEAQAYAANLTLQMKMYEQMLDTIDECVVKSNLSVANDVINRIKEMQ